MTAHTSIPSFIRRHAAVLSYVYVVPAALLAVVIFAA